MPKKTPKKKGTENAIARVTPRKSKEKKSPRRERLTMVRKSPRKHGVDVSKEVTREPAQEESALETLQDHAREAIQKNAVSNES